VDAGHLSSSRGEKRDEQMVCGGYQAAASVVIMMVMGFARRHLVSHFTKENERECYSPFPHRSGDAATQGGGNAETVEESAERGRGMLVSTPSWAVRRHMFRKGPRASKGGGREFWRGGREGRGRIKGRSGGGGEGGCEGKGKEEKDQEKMERRDRS
jgi:hypothetical protein